MTLFFLLAGMAIAMDNITIDKNAAKLFASLPDGVAYPEGITVNPKSGEIYVSTFNFGGNNKLLRYSPNGKLLAQINYGVTPLLGVAFNSVDDKIYICNFGLSMIHRIDANYDEASTVENVAQIPIIGAPPNRTVVNPDESEEAIVYGINFPAPNGLAFDQNSNLYISDSLQKVIFKINDATYCIAPCPVEKIKNDGLLAKAGFPSFGANGMGLSKA